MKRGDTDEHDELARSKRADPMDDQAVDDVEPFPRLNLDLLEGGLGHARVVLERERGRSVAIHLTDGADEGCDRTNLQVAIVQLLDLRAGIKGFVLNPDRHLAARDRREESEFAALLDLHRIGCELVVQRRANPRLGECRAPLFRTGRKEFARRADGAYTIWQFDPFAIGLELFSKRCEQPQIDHHGRHPSIENGRNLTMSPGRIARPPGLSTSPSPHTVEVNTAEP